MMSEGKRVQCLLFVASNRNPGSLNKSSCFSSNSVIKGYALLPQSFRGGHPEVVEIFSRNDVRVITNAQDNSSLQIKTLTLRNYTLKMFEIQLIIKSPQSETEDVSSDVSNPLLIFVDKFNKEVVESLFSKSVNIFCPSDEDLTDYVRVDCDDDFEAMKDLSLYGKTIGYRHLSDGTILHFAVEKGMKNLVKLLLQYKADLNAKQLNGKTPLHVAAKKGREDIFGTLLEHGADVNARRHDGLTPLHIAAAEGHVSIVKSLLQHGANVDTTVEVDDQRGWSPLVFAQHNRHNEVAELLLETGADVNIVFDHCTNNPSKLYLSSPEEQVKGITKATILYSAALMTNYKFIKLILRHQPDMANEYNRRAFHYVLLEVEDVFIDIFEQMKEYGFTVDYDRFDNSVKFLFGAIHKNCFEVVRKLVEEGVDVNKVYEYNRRSSDCTTPLHIAARYAGTNIIKLLVDRGADVSAEWRKQFPIHNAIICNNINAVKYFVARKINFPDKAGLIILAAGIGSSEMIEFLLHSVHPLTFKNEYNKAVGLAIFSGRMEILELLFKYGAQLGSECINYKILFQAVLRKGYADIFQAILDHSFINDTCTKFIEVFRELEHQDMNQFDVHRERYEICSNILAQQILKLEAASLYTFDQNISSIWHANESMNDFRIRCDMEIALMKSEKVGDSQVSVYDILTPNLSRLAGLARNNSIVKAMKDDDHRIKFPIYCSVLNCHFKKGLQREKLMQQGIKTCNILFPQKRFHILPLELKVKVIDYVSNHELLILNNILPSKTQAEGQ